MKRGKTGKDKKKSGTFAECLPKEYSKETHEQYALPLHANKTPRAGLVKQNK